MDETEVYDFNVFPSEAQLDLLVEEAAAQAREERLSRGLDEQARPPLGGEPRREVEEVQPGGPIGSRIPEGQRGPGRAAEAGAPAVRMGGGDAGVAFPEQSALPSGGVELGAQDAPPPDGDDARTLPVRYASTGLRHREFRSALELMSEDDYSDFPIRGPRTCK